MPLAGIRAGQHLPGSGHPRASGTPEARTSAGPAQGPRTRPWPRVSSRAKCVETIHAPVPSAHGVLAEPGGGHDVVVDPQSHVVGDRECHG
jgi:hypothetical protein